jgi:hypothetical protein
VNVLGPIPNLITCCVWLLPAGEMLAAVGHAMSLLGTNTALGVAHDVVPLADEHSYLSQKSKMCSTGLASSVSLCDR